MEEKKGKMTVEEAGRRGGLKTSETHGEEFYSEIGRKGGRIGGPKRRSTSTETDRGRQKHTRKSRLLNRTFFVSFIFSFTSLALPLHVPCPVFG